MAGIYDDNCFKWLTIANNRDLLTTTVKIGKNTGNEKLIDREPA
jgi:hypothetical protein